MKRAKRRYEYKPRQPDTQLHRRRSYEIDEEIQSRKMPLGELIRRGAPFTDEQRALMAEMADRLTTPKKRGGQKKTVLSPKEEIERRAAKIVARMLNHESRRKANGSLEDGVLDELIDRVLDLLGEDGWLDDLRLAPHELDLMRENVRSALTHGKRSRARIPPSR